MTATVTMIDIAVATSPIAATHPALDAAGAARAAAPTAGLPKHRAPLAIGRVVDAASVLVCGASVQDAASGFARWALMVIGSAGGLAPLQPVQPGPARRYSRRPTPTGEAATPFGLRWRETEAMSQGHRAAWANRP